MLCSKSSPLLCSNDRALSSEGFFPPCFLVVQCWSNLLSAKNLLPPHASNMRQKARRCTAENWIKYEGRLQVHVEGILSQLGEECPLAGGSLHRHLCVPHRQGSVCRGALCPPLRSSASLALFLAFWNTAPSRIRPQGRRIEKYWKENNRSCWK